MIDWQRVQVLRDEVGPEDFEEVVALFLEEVEEVTARLATSPTDNTLETELHFLKGSALSMGFQDFSAYCQQGETLSAQGQAAEVNLPALLACYHKSKDQFLTDLPSVLSP